MLEPLRWALVLRPRWIACEQVEPVLALWEAMAGALRIHGYRCWTGVLSAERYGVAQVRRRAFLLASLDREVHGPPATHQRYIAPRRRDEQTLCLFDAPEPERIVAPEDRRLLPWVIMAEALGWAMTDRPAPTIWTAERPATTANGDPRISEPGHQDSEVSGSQQANAVRVTLAEALVLQGFPPDYPVQGAKTKRFEQVGNAVPPLLAWHVLRAVLPAVGVLKEAA